MLDDYDLLEQSHYQTIQDRKSSEARVSFGTLTLYLGGGNLELHGQGSSQNGRHQRSHAAQEGNKELQISLEEFSLIKGEHHAKTKVNWSNCYAHKNTEGLSLIDFCSIVQVDHFSF